MTLAVFTAAALLAAPTFATTLEEDKAAAFEVQLEQQIETDAIEGTEFVQAGLELPPHIKFEEPIFETPKFGPNAAGLGRDLGGFKLSDRLNSHSDLFTRKLGTRDWDLSVAGDPKFEISYLRLERPDEKQLHKIKDINELRGKGVNIKVDEKTIYNFKVSINIFSPTRGSTLKITPIQGTNGPKHKIKTGKILDRVEEESFVFKTAGKEFWTLYGTDVDPETNWFADTRSFLVIHENGLSTKAYPIGEGKLPIGQAVAVTLGDAKVVLRRSEDGFIRFYEPGKKVGPIAKR